MEIKGKIIQELQLQTGTSKKGTWQKQEYILETQSEYPKKVCIAVWGDKIDQLNLGVGDEATVSFQLESREHNGRWYTEVRAWKVEDHKFAGPRKSASSAPAPQKSSDLDKHMESATDDLPF